jgi:hypothetical protein
MSPLSIQQRLNQHMRHNTEVHKASIPEETEDIQEWNENKSMKWACDVCKEAEFESYVDAFRHELECRKKLYLDQHHHQRELETKAQSEPDRISAERRAWRRAEMKRQLYEKSRSICSGNESPSSSSNQKSADTWPQHEKKWLCSVCKEVYFEHYIDACRHERQCILTHSPGQQHSLPRPSLQQRREQYFA